MTEIPRQEKPIALTVDAGCAGTTRQRFVNLIVRAYQNWSTAPAEQSFRVVRPTFHHR